MVKDDKSPDPLNVRVFGPPAVVPCSDGMPHAIEELRLRSRLGERNNRGCRETVSHARVVRVEMIDVLACDDLLLDEDRRRHGTAAEDLERKTDQPIAVLLGKVPD